MPIDWEDKPSSDDIWTFPQWMFDFDNGEWTDTSYYENDSSSSSNNGDLDNFYTYSSPSAPARNEYIDLTVRARDDDNDTLD
jgi:hypothetical protein